MVKNSIVYKVVFMGDSGVGKSSIATRISCNTFTPLSDATIGASFFSKIIEKETQMYKFNIWDTAGQEKYSCLVPLYYRNCDAAIIVYDITNRNSFKKITSSIKELRQDSTVWAIFIIGNKSDLDKERMVTTKEAKDFCDLEDVSFMETSAKNNINIHEILGKLIEKLPEPNTKEKATLPSVHPLDSNSYLNCCQ